MSTLRDTLFMSSSTPASILEFSPFLTQLVTRHPEWLESLKNSGRLENFSPPDEKQLAAAIEASGLDAGLSSSETAK